MPWPADAPIRLQSAPKPETTVNWTSLDQFLHMGGYGLYVWGSYGMTLAWMLAEPLLVHRRLQAARANLGREDGTA